MENQGQTPPPQQFQQETYKPWGMETKTFCLLMHLAVFTPIAGVIMPIIMWATNKDQSPEVDAHGKNILNWVISFVIYLIGGLVLSLVFIGVLVIFALVICMIVFAILGAVAASKGEIYEYPLAIKFIK